MNLLASFQKGSSCHANIIAAAVTLAILFAAQWPLTARAVDAVLVGSNVTFIATADGTPAPTFQWRKNGTAIAGATAATLSLSGVTTGDAATYQVVASNELGTTVSPNEVLLVETGPIEGTNIPPAI